MRIFGHKWDDDDRYSEGILDGVQALVMTHSNFPEYPPKGPLTYYCDLCGIDFTHYLVADRTWKRLPTGVQHLRICPGCFTSVRELQRRKVIRKCN